MDTEKSSALQEIARLQAENDSLLNDHSVLEHKHKTLKHKYSELKKEEEVTRDTMRSNEEEVKRQDAVIEDMEDEIHLLRAIHSINTEQPHPDSLICQNTAYAQFIEKEGLTEQFAKEQGHVDEVATQFNYVGLNGQIEGQNIYLDQKNTEMLDFEMEEMTGEPDHSNICPQWARKGKCRYADAGEKCNDGW